MLIKVLVASLCLLTSCGVVGTGSVSNEHLRLAKIKSLSWENPSASFLSSKLIPATFNISEFSDRRFRYMDWAENWRIATDGNYTLHIGGLAKSKTDYAMFAIVWNRNITSPVFYEIDGESWGRYPSGLKSSP